MIRSISNNVTSFFTFIKSTLNSLLSRIANLALQIFSKKDDLAQTHYKFKASLDTFLKNRKITQNSFIFTEKQLLKGLELINHKEGIYLLNGPNLLERLAKEAQGFEEVQKIDDLAITHNTKIDLVRTPIELTQINQNTHQFGSLNPTRDLETQIKDLKKRFIESLGNTPESLKIIEIAINCIHQEQIKSSHTYLSKILPPNIYPETQKTNRLFSIIINQDRSIFIKETLTAKLQDTSCGAPKDLGLLATCSYDYKICPNGDIENTKHSITLFKE